MTVFDNLKKLADSFYHDVQLAKRMNSVNPEDDLVIKISIVGFSYNSDAQDWDKGHFDFLKSRIDRHYSEEELAYYGENAENVTLFFALGIGYLLGLYQKGKLNDIEFQQAEQQIPGLIMYYLARLTERPVEKA